jgi:hypothetical protein
MVKKDKCRKIALSRLFQLGDLLPIHRLDDLPDRIGLVSLEFFVEFSRNGSLLAMFTRDCHSFERVKNLLCPSLALSFAPALKGQADSYFWWEQIAFTVDV